MFRFLANLAGILMDNSFCDICQKFRVEIPVIHQQLSASDTDKKAGLL